MFAHRRDRACGIHTGGTFPTVVHDDLVEAHPRPLIISVDRLTACGLERAEAFQGVLSGRSTLAGICARVSAEAAFAWLRQRLMPSLPKRLGARSGRWEWA
jgi:hypothetical protein